MNQLINIEQNVERKENFYFMTTINEKICFVIELKIDMWTKLNIWMNR